MEMFLATFFPPTPQQQEGDPLAVPSFEPAPKRTKVTVDGQYVRQQQQQGEPSVDHQYMSMAQAPPVILPSAGFVPLAVNTAARPQPTYSTIPLSDACQTVPMQQLPAPILPTSDILMMNPTDQPPNNNNIMSPQETIQLERIAKRRKRCKENSRKLRANTRNLESQLQLELVALQKENEHLRAVVKQEIPHAAQEIIGECCYKPRGDGYFHGGQSSRLGRSDFELIENLTRTKQSFVLTDPRLPDNPIVFCSSAFYKLTGYSHDQVMGRNCRFLQGLETDSDNVKEIREAIQNGKDGTTFLLNYKADGTTFWNHLFVAALRDQEKRIVNYVGVQSPVEKAAVPTKTKPSTRTHNEKKKKYPSRQSSTSDRNDGLPQADLTTSSSNCDPVTNSNNNSSSSLFLHDSTTNLLDWAEIAEFLETDNKSMGSSTADGSSMLSGSDYLDEVVAPLSDSEIGRQEILSESDDSETRTNFDSIVTDRKTLLGQLFKSPSREFVTRTIRSELIGILLQTNGDVTDTRFLFALDVLSRIFKSSTSYNTALSSVLNGSWRSLSRPSYHNAGCLGKNARGDFVYTLGKMCFNMFKPGNARVTVQETMNNIKAVGQSDNCPSAAPWSLRREIAAHEDPEMFQPELYCKLKSYDIVIALTIEPGQFESPNEKIASPPCRLQATQVVHGYFLPDPETPNRLTVWFTGGELAPVDPPSPGQQEGNSDAEERFGSRPDWIEYFGAEHKRTWGETLSIMGAKLFLGAELPEEMDANGTMSYTLHRPYGGHGKAYADVLYVDDSVLITRGNSHTVHVMVADR